MPRNSDRRRRVAQRGGSVETQRSRFFADSLLVPPADANSKLFPTVVPTVLHAWLVRGSAEELADPQSRKKLEAAFPPAKFGWVPPDDRLDSRSFYRYLSWTGDFPPGRLRHADRAISLAGGQVRSPVVAGSTDAEEPTLSELGAGKVAAPFLAGPLLEMNARRKLVWTVHVVYFGLVIAGSLLIFNVPEGAGCSSWQGSRGACDKEQSAGHRGRGVPRWKYSPRRRCNICGQFSAGFTRRDHPAVDRVAGQRGYCRGGARPALGPRSSRRRSTRWPSACCRTP